MEMSGALAKKALTIFGILNPNHGSILNKFNSPSESMINVVDEPKTISDESENIVEFMNKQIIRPGKGVESRVSADTLVESHFFANLSFTFTKLTIIWKRTNALRIICRIFEITKSSIFTMGT